MGLNFGFDLLLKNSELSTILRFSFPFHIIYNKYTISPMFPDTLAYLLHFLPTDKHIVLNLMPII